MVRNRDLQEPARSGGLSVIRFHYPMCPKQQPKRLFNERNNWEWLNILHNEKQFTVCVFRLNVINDTTVAPMMKKHSLKKRVYCTILFLHCLFEFYMVVKGQHQSRLQAVYQSAQVIAVSPSFKMWFHSLTAQVMYSACITHCFVALVVFFCCVSCPHNWI